MQIGGPERLLPTESSGIDLREARSMNRPGRDFEDRPPRRMDRDGEEGPRRTFSRRTEESGSGRAGESDDDWRTGAAPRRVESSYAAPERVARRSTEEREDAPADREDDWRAGASSRPSAFGDRRNARREEEDMGPRRFSSRRVEDSRADDEDWRRPGLVDKKEEEFSSATRIERTRSIRPSPTQRSDEAEEWRTARQSSSSTPWTRRRSAEEEISSTPQTRKSPIVARKLVVPPKEEEEAKWSSSDDEEDEKEDIIIKPDLEKISKFASKLGQYVEQSAGEDMTRKIDALVKKVPTNFTKAELSSLETMRAVLLTILKSELLSSETDVERLVALISPVLVCLEDQYVVFGGEIAEFQTHVIEQVQISVASIGCPRLSPQTALVEQIWLSLYESKAVCEEVFSQWLDLESLESPNKATTLFQTQAFIAWLEEKELPGVAASARQSAVDEDKDEWESSDDSDIEALVPKRVTGAQIRLGAVAPLRK